MALLFNGTTQYISQAAMPGSGAPPLTMSCWYKPTNNTNNVTVMCVGASGAITYLSLDINAGVPQALEVVAGASVTATSGATLTAGAWNHVAAVFTSASSRTIWVNGVSVSSSTASSAISGLNGVTVGVKNDNGSFLRFANGNVAYPAIWDSALTSGDIATLYNSGSGSDPSQVESASLLSFSYLDTPAPYLDIKDGVNWTAVSTPTAATNPFSIAATLTVQAATAITNTTATLNATIVGSSGATVEGFNYGTTTGYGSVASNTPGPFGTGAYSINLTGLTPNTTYHYQAFVTNPNGTVTTSDQTFSTPGPLPTVINIPVTGLGSTTAILTGQVTAIGSGTPTSAGFNYGTTSGYGTTANASGTSFPAGSVFTISLSGLTPSTTYHFQSFAINGTGEGVTVDATFTTFAGTWGTYYLDACTPGSDSNNGTSPSTPWATLAHATSTLPTNYGNFYVMYPDGVYRLIAPIWNGFLAYYPMMIASSFLASATQMYEIYNGNHGSMGGTDTSWATIGLQFNGFSGSLRSCLTFLNYSTLGATTSAGFIIDKTASGSSDPVAFSIGADSSNNNRIDFSSPFTDGNVYWDFGNNTTGRISASTGSLAGQRHVWGCLAGGSYQAIYQDATKLSSRASNQTYTQGNGYTGMRIGNNNPLAATSQFVGFMYAFMCTNNVLPDANYLSLQSWLSAIEAPRKPSNPSTLTDVHPSPVPIMGWDSWRPYNTSNISTVTDAEIRANADAMVSTGLASLGYNVVSITEPWGTTRDGSGNLLADTTRFPSGIAPVVSYLQAKGLKYGAYLGAGTLTCGGNTGSYFHEQQDASLVASLGAVYVMYDNCQDFLTIQQFYNVYLSLQLGFLKASGTPPALLVSCPNYTDNGVNGFGSDCLLWYKNIGASYCICSADLGDPGTYTKLQTLATNQASRQQYMSQGHYLFSDFLCTAQPGVSVAEGRSGFSLYCIWQQPLTIATVVSSISSSDLATFKNTEMIAVNQDPGGIPSYRLSHTAQGAGFLDVWVKTLLNGTVVVLMANSDSVSNSMSVTWSAIGVTSTPIVRDLWAHSDLGSISTSYTTTVPSHDVAVLLVVPGGLDLSAHCSSTTSTSANIYIAKQLTAHVQSITPASARIYIAKQLLAHVNSVTAAAGNIGTGYFLDTTTLKFYVIR